MNTTTDTATTPNAFVFNEAQWLQVLFLLADTATWLQQLQEGLIWQLPVQQHKKLLRKSWYLSATVLAHILERHYYKLPRHPLAGKFTISIPEIVNAIKEAGQLSPEPLAGSANLQRVWEAGYSLGYDPAGNTVTIMTIISSTAGKLLPLFPAG
ncbi:hypothetical protein [Niabella hibiscisoli]|uniref:hypothetical protein n=1 Tax=Niabella hibiscisoli TaxID=1825928 RepID=UPI001F0E3804|nr:hypothetical protein [Niabella hibiscisoli]MCH5720499.1 hypothetical protein [Niabella hibiscisoli]